MKISSKLLPEIKIYSSLVSMSQDNLIKLQNKQTGEIYFSRKNRKKVERKVELSKYSKKLRKHVKFVETKK